MGGRGVADPGRRAARARRRGCRARGHSERPCADGRRTAPVRLLACPRAPGRGRGPRIRGTRQAARRGRLGGRGEPPVAVRRRLGAPERPGTLSPMSPAMGTLDKALRFGEGRRLKRVGEQAAYITTLEPDFRKLSDAELLAKTSEFKQRLENGESLEELLFEAFAAVREARLRES